MPLKNSISVLIANYNWDVTELVKKIHSQLSHTQWSFEILCYDNASNSGFFDSNNALNSLDGVTYRQELDHIGRSQNRNKLANDAQHEWYLFLDGDSAVNDTNFISNYLKSTTSSQVICGGTAYAEKPENLNQLLRWTYGKEREEISADIRNEQPNQGFSSFNFLIYHEAFKMVGFDNNLTQYGHEDTLLGQELEKHGFIVNHINNPLVHLGLDDSEVFLKKTRMAIDNLHLLISQKQITHESKLIKAKKFLSKTGTNGIMQSLFNIRRSKWETELKGPSPNMRTFDKYKLGYLSTLR